LPWQKLHSTRRRCFYQQIGHKFKKDLVKWSTAVCGTEPWTVRTADLKYPGRALKYGAGEGRRRLLGSIMWEVKKYYIQSRGRGISYKQ